MNDIKYFRIFHQCSNICFNRHTRQARSQWLRERTDFQRSSTTTTTTTRTIIISSIDDAVSGTCWTDNNTGALISHQSHQNRLTLLCEQTASCHLLIPYTFVRFGRKIVCELVVKTNLSPVCSDWQRCNRYEQLVIAICSSQRDNAWNRYQLSMHMYHIMQCLKFVNNFLKWNLINVE